jgi:signal transduction histidine kinase
VPAGHTSSPLGTRAGWAHVFPAELTPKIRKFWLSQRGRRASEAKAGARGPAAPPARTPDRAPWPTIAERAVGQAARLEVLIQQLLLLAKADEHELSAHQQPVDIGALLRDLAAATAAHHLDVDVQAANGLSTSGNPDHLRRLFGNIIDNAVRYAHSRVLVTASQSAAGLRVEIDDDGPGIPAAERDRVFDRFVRLDQSRERGGGGTTGLGLAIARDIALAHGGKIAVAGNLSGGARMIITLPATATDAPLTRADNRDAMPSDRTSDGTSNGTSDRTSDRASDRLRGSS